MDTSLLKWKKTSNHNYIFSFLKKEEFVDFIGKFLIELGFGDEDVLKVDEHYPDIGEGAHYHMENSKYFIDLITGSESIFMFVQCSLEDRKAIDNAFKKQGIKLESH